MIKIKQAYKIVFFIDCGSLNSSNNRTKSIDSRVINLLYNSINEVNISLYGTNIVNTITNEYYEYRFKASLSISQN